MKLPGVFLDILDVVVPTKVEPWRPHIRPGDAVTFSSDVVGGDVPLMMLTMDQSLELEAFSGRPQNEVTGWIRCREVALVVGVDGTHAFLYAPRGRGWVDTMYLVSLQDISGPGKGATVDLHQKAFLGAA